MTDVTRQTYRELSDRDKVEIKSVKDAGDAFLKELDHLPPSREISLARTKVEEAVMWAVKGITS